MLLWIVATLCAFYIKGLCGFANTLVFTSILNYTNANIEISPVELILGYPTNAIIVWKERKSIDWRMSLPIIALVILGNILGILLLKNADTTAIKLFFGIVIVLISAEMFLRSFQKKQKKTNKTVMAIIGILSGILCGLYGVGALLGAYISRATNNNSSFRANICLVFLCENTLRIVLYSVLGILSLDMLKRAIILVPFMLLGLFLGIKSSGIIKESIAKKLVIMMLFLSGLSMIALNL